MNESWPFKKLGDICDSELGKTLNQSKDSGILRPYLCSINILWDFIDTTILKKAKFNSYEVDRYSVREGDLLICEGGDIGRAAIWHGEETPYQNALHRIRFRDKKYSPRFYLLFLRYLKKKNILDTKYGKGVTIKHLVKSSLLSIPVPTPPIEEQERIVAELDLLTGIIDKQRAQLRELDTLARSIFYDMFGDPVNNEKCWEVKILGDVLKTTSGGTPAKGHPEYYENGDISWVNSGDLHQMFIYDTPKHITQEGMDNSSAKLFPVDTCLIAMYGATVGEVSILKIQSTTNQAVCGIFPSPKYLPIFLYSTLKYSKNHFVDLASGGAQPNISQGIIKDFGIISPSIKIQKSFVDKIASIERQKESIICSIAETQKLFDYTMDKYFG